jgi:hypothetical protein
MNKNTKHLFLSILIVISYLLCTSLNSSDASISSKAFRETWEYILKKSFNEVVEEGGEKILKKQFKNLVTKYGDKIIPIIKKVGPRGIKIAEKYGNPAIRAMEKYGDEALIVLRRDAAEVAPLLKRYGDDVMEACIKQPGIGKNLVSEFGAKGIVVAKKVSRPQSIKLLRIKSQIKGSGKTKEILDLIEKYGGKVIDHLDKHKKLYFVYAPAGFLITKAGLDFIENPDKYFTAVATSASKGSRTLITGIGDSKDLSTGEKILNNMSVIIFFAIFGLTPILFIIYLRHKRKIHSTQKF